LEGGEGGKGGERQHRAAAPSRRQQCVTHILLPPFVSPVEAAPASPLPTARILTIKGALESRKNAEKSPKLPEKAERFVVFERRLVVVYDPGDLDAQ
jgi:hypothetical protein